MAFSASLRSFLRSVEVLCLLAGGAADDAAEESAGVGMRIGGVGDGAIDDPFLAASISDRATAEVVAADARLCNAL